MTGHELIAKLQKFTKEELKLEILHEYDSRWSSLSGIKVQDVEEEGLEIIAWEHTAEELAAIKSVLPKKVLMFETEYPAALHAFAELETKMYRNFMLNSQDSGAGGQENP